MPKFVIESTEAFYVPSLIETAQYSWHIKDHLQALKLMNALTRGALPLGAALRVLESEPEAYFLSGEDVHIHVTREECGYEKRKKATRRNTTDQSNQNEDQESNSEVETTEKTA